MTIVHRIPPGDRARPTNPTASAARDLQFLPTRDLLAEVECWQWLALDVAAAGDTESRQYAEFHLGLMVAELERRQRLRKARASDPLRPPWPRRDDSLTRRVEAVKAAWPIERYCRQMLGMDLTPAGAGRWKARCPLPGHEDRTPSFLVTEANGFAWCFACGDGGDVIWLTQRIGGRRFYDALDLLEREGGQR